MASSHQTIFQAGALGSRHHPRPDTGVCSPSRLPQTPSRRLLSHHPSLTCRSSSTSSTVSAQEPAAGAPHRQRQTDPLETDIPPEALPKELATLTDLVAQLSEKSEKSSEVEVTELKKAFGALAEDLKRQISSVNLSSPPQQSSPSTAALFSSRSIPGRRRLPPPTDAETFRASSGLSDLEGLFPRSTQSDKAADSDENGTAAEPGIPRSEVIAMRSRLNKKLSESNTYNRFLLREIQYREEAIKDTKSVLVALLSELQEVKSGLAELATVESFLPAANVHPSCRPSILKVKLEGLTEDLEKQLQGVESMRLREVPLTWFGMAEDVKVMGSFDGWTYGEQMSPESTGTMTKFTTALKLRPGSYEIKFLVDGEWRVAPEWPTVGHGMLENNVLVVE